MDDPQSLSDHTWSQTFPHYASMPFPNESTVYEVYINEAVAADRELVKDWNSSLNFLLVFAAIFSAVLTGFIVESNSMLQQDSSDLILDALIHFINGSANGTMTAYTPPPFQPTRLAVVVNCFFYASLSSSVVAALASVIALQWVSEYDALVTRAGSSPEDRMRRRHFYHTGVEKWRMHGVIASLPLLLYLSLLLFGAGLTRWMLHLNKPVGWVVVAGGSLGAAFYIVTTFLAIMFPACPFRTPLAKWLYLSANRFLSLISPSLFTSRHYRDSSSSDSDMPSQSSSKDSWWKSFILSIIRSKFGESFLERRDEMDMKNSGKYLLGAGLCWLAEKISVSEDSYRRITLLARSVSELSDFETATANFRVPDWTGMFEIFANELWKRVDERELGLTDEMEILPFFKTMSKSHLGSLFQENYSSNELQAIHCLLRCAERPSRSRSHKHTIEEKVKMCIYLANLARKSPTRKGESLSMYFCAMGDSDTIHLSMIHQLGASIIADPKHDSQQRVDELLSIAALRQPIDTNLSIELRGKRGAVIVIVNPSLPLYRLQYLDWIKSTPISGLSQVVSALLAARRENPSLRPFFRFLASDEEVKTACTLVKEGSQGSLREIMEEERRNDRVISTLEAVDPLVASRDWYRESPLMELLVTEMQMESWIRSNSSTLDTQKVWLLRNPLLRVLGCATLEVRWSNQWPDPWPDHRFLSKGWVSVSRFCLGDHPSHARNIWDLRVKLWRNFARPITGPYVAQSLSDKDEWSKFLNRFVMVHNKGYSDYILRLVHDANRNLEVRGARNVFGFIPYLLSRPQAHKPLDTVQGSNDKASRDLRTMLLSAPLASYNVHEDCIAYILRLCDEIKGYPRRFIIILAALLRTDWEDYNYGKSFPDEPYKIRALEESRDLFRKAASDLLTVTPLNLFLLLPLMERVLTQEVVQNVDKEARTMLANCISDVQSMYLTRWEKSWDNLYKPQDVFVENCYQMMQLLTSSNDLQSILEQEG